MFAIKTSIYLSSKTILTTYIQTLTCQTEDARAARTDPSYRRARSWCCRPLPDRPYSATVSAWRPDRADADRASPLAWAADAYHRPHHFHRRLTALNDAAAVAAGGSCAAAVAAAAAAVGTFVAVTHLEPIQTPAAHCEHVYDRVEDVWLYYFEG